MQMKNRMAKIKIHKGEISFDLTFFQLIKSFITKNFEFNNAQINVNEGDYEVIYEWRNK